MEIKKTPPINKQNAERKNEEKIPPRRNFHEVMGARKVPRQPEKRRSVFDLASKKDENPEGSKKKNKVDHPIQHGEGVQEGIAPLEVGESLSVNSVHELSPEMATLVEKMANYIMVECQNGVSTTTVIVEMEGSALDGSEIVIDHYDTAPHSFNLQLSGSPEATDLFTTNLAFLQLSLQSHQVLQGFQVNVLPPILGEKSELYTRGREKTVKFGSKDKRSFVQAKKKISF